MHVLLLDTSTDYAITGICDELGRVISSQSQQHERQLSVRLYTMIEQVLSDAGIDRTQIDALSVGLGPGSFTGVRVAVTTMRTLAQVLQKPLYAFGTLDSLAETAWLTHPSLRQSPALAILPSRRNEVYAQVYSHGSAVGQSEAISYAYAIAKLDSLGKDGVVICPDVLLSALFDGRDTDQLIKIDQPSIESMAGLTNLAISSGSTRNPLSLDPMYVAPPAVSQHKTVK